MIRGAVGFSVGLGVTHLVLLMIFFAFERVSHMTFLMHKLFPH